MIYSFLILTIKKLTYGCILNRLFGLCADQHEEECLHFMDLLSNDWPKEPTFVLPFFITFAFQEHFNE